MAFNEQYGSGPMDVTFLLSPAPPHPPTLTHLYATQIHTNTSNTPTFPQVATCFDMKSTVREGLYFLFYGSVFLYITCVVAREATRTIVNTYDAGRLEQKREWTDKQSEFFATRIRRLAKFGCVKKIQGEDKETEATAFEEEPVKANGKADEAAEQPQQEATEPEPEAKQPEEPQEGAEAAV